MLIGAGSCNAQVVSIGTTLPMPPHEGFGLILSCNSCVLTSPSVPNGASDVSPVDGAIIRWHLNKAIVEGGSGFRLRVLTRRDDEYVAAGRSASEIPTGISAVETFPAELPIRAGQLIGLELENSQSEIRVGSSPGAEPVLLEPAIADGEAGTPPTWWGEAWWAMGSIFPFNAEILLPPTISNVSPAKVPHSGGNEVSIAGENFALLKSVTFGSTEASYKVNSEAELTAIVPAGVAGTSVPVSVVTAAGRAEATVDYAYEAPPVSESVSEPALSGCVVPRLKQRRLKAVKRMLGRSNCSLGRVKMRHHATTRSGRVKKQSPHPGTALPSGSLVEVTLGLTHRQT
jgi:hypothetical protein